jgi:hypothetical protein
MAIGLYVDISALASSSLLGTSTRYYVNFSNDPDDICINACNRN